MAVSRFLCKIDGKVCHIVDTKVLKLYFMSVFLGEIDGINLRVMIQLLLKSDFGHVRMWLQIVRADTRIICKHQCQFLLTQPKGNVNLSTMTY